MSSPFLRLKRGNQLILILVTYTIYYSHTYEYSYEKLVSLQMPRKIICLLSQTLFSLNHCGRKALSMYPLELK